MDVIKREKFGPNITGAPTEQLLDESLDHLAYKYSFPKISESYREVEYSFPNTGINVRLGISTKTGQRPPLREVKAILGYVPAKDCKEDVGLIREKLEKILAIA